MEACLQDFPDSEKQALIRLLTPAARDLALNPYGSFVLKKLIDISNESQRRSLWTHLRAHMDEIRIRNYGLYKRAELWTLGRPAVVSKATGSNSVNISGAEKRLDVSSVKRSALKRGAPAENDEVLAINARDGPEKCQRPHKRRAV